MAMTAGELFRRVSESFEYDLEITAGKDFTELPVLRVTVVEDRTSAEKVQKHDAVIFHTTRHRKCSILDAAELLSVNGACALIISRDEYSAYELEQLRLLSDRLSMPLMEVGSADCLPALISLVYEEIIRFYEPVISVSKLLQEIIAMPELYRYYGGILTQYGFAEYSDYCVAVCHFVGKGGFSDACSGMTSVIRHIENGLTMQDSSAAILDMGYQVAVVFADTDADSAIAVLKQGLSAIPQELGDGYSIYIGVSYRANGIVSLPVLFDYAAKTAIIQMCRGKDRCPLSYSEQRLNRFMISLKDREAINFLVQETLNKLAEYDRQNDTDYISLLRAYFRNNCSLQNTAKELFVHRNSVNYALRKIERIMECSLSDINTKAELLLVLGFSELSDDYSSLRKDLPPGKEHGRR